MKKKSKPQEVTTNNAKPTSLYDSASIHKAPKAVLKFTTELLQRKVHLFYKDLDYEDTLVEALIELFNALQIDQMTNRISTTHTVKLEFLQIIDSVTQVFKSMTIHDNYRGQDLGLLQFVNSKVDHLFKLTLLFDNRRDLNRQETLVHSLINLVCSIRNLTHSSSSREAHIDTDTIGVLFAIMDKLSGVEDLRVNILRIISKISTAEQICDYLCSNSYLVDKLVQMLGEYKENKFVVMRTSYILANLTAFRESTATYVYFHDKGIVFGVFEHYISKTSQEDEFYETMLKSFAEFDFLNQDDKKVLNKIIRLLANMFTVEEPALHFIKERFNQYKQLLRKMRYFMTDNELGANSELLVSVLNCISNILYYDRPNLTQNDFELAQIKDDLAAAVAYITLQPHDEEVLIEGLRVISNLSRSKTGVKTLLKLKFPDAINVLLKHRSREVVFYSIGVLINLSASKDFKESDMCKDLFGGLVDLLSECTIDDIDILSCIFKALANIISENLKNSGDIMTDRFTRLDLLLANFGEECDIILTSEELDMDEQEQIKSLRALINTVVNISPEEEFECQQPGCLRKFKTKALLEAHIIKRHK